VGEHVTRYVRRGSGSPVIVVGANVNSNTIWAPLVEALANRHRLFIPQIPPSEPDLTTWLRSFIDGIGACSAALIAGGAAQVPARALAAADEFTIDKLVLIPDGESHGANPPSIQVQPSTIDAGRVLSVAPDWRPDDAVARIEQFISENGAAS
jgi:hypothetical protein